MKGRKIGEILEDMDCLSKTNLFIGLEIEEQTNPRKLLGEILIGENIVNRTEVERALALQEHLNSLN